MSDLADISHSRSKLFAQRLDLQGPILRWTQQLGTMNDFIGFILFLLGYIRSYIANLWESFASRRRTTDFFASETMELPELVDQDQIGTPQQRRPRKRKLPVPPAFRREKDYPVNWLVYSKTLGVVPKSQADKLLEEIETGCLGDEESKNDRPDRAVIEFAPTLITRAASEPPTLTTSSLASSIKDRSQSEDKSNWKSQVRDTNGFSPVLPSVVAT